MPILLTGGAGFIGSHTAIELINARYDVVIADNFSNSHPSVIDRITTITGVKVPCYAIDVADTAKLDEVFAENDIDAVMHFAGFKAVGESVQKPIMYYRNNLDTTLALLEVMTKHSVKKFIFSSSATVYGENAKVPYTENAPTGSCTNPYGRTKYFIELILADAAIADPELSVVLLRYFDLAPENRTSYNVRKERKRLTKELKEDGKKELHSRANYRQATGSRTAL